MLQSYLSLLIFLALTFLSGCADVPTSSEDYARFKEINDPLEPMNRVVFDVNDFLDQLLLLPIAELYRFLLPSIIRDRVTDIVLNSKEPVIFVNNILQGQFQRAGTTFERFAINTTLGVGGMWDVAGDWYDEPQQTGDFGQTLYVWGVKEGPYTVLPLLGPSNFRDKVGLLVDLLLSPWAYLTYVNSPGIFVDYEAIFFGTNLLIKREQNIETLDMLRRGSVDYYAEIRSVYRQYRAKQIGEPATPEPNFDEN
jgi:phospholipid-binding lipoprotein MlaA